MHSRGGAPKTAVQSGGRLPGVYSFVGPIVDSMPMGTGIIKALSTVAAGGSLTVTHGLGRVPVFVDVLVNGTPDYRGGCRITASTSTTVTVMFEKAQTAASFLYVT